MRVDVRREQLRKFDVYLVFVVGTLDNSCYRTTVERSRRLRQTLLATLAELRGGHASPPELGLDKFQERPSGASGIQQNLLAAGSPPRTPLEELAALPQTS